MGGGAVIVRELRENEVGVALGLGHSVTIRWRMPMPTVLELKITGRGLRKSR